MTTAPSEPVPPTTRVAVLGLGPMGTAIATALRRAEVDVVVWNRTPGRTEPLALLGAAVASSPEQAVAEAGLVLVVLRDHIATRQVLATVPDEAFAERTVVSLASSSPEVARTSAAWAEARDIAWLSGAILAPTPLVGRPEAMVLYSGDPELLAAHRDVLRVIAGDARHVGVDHGAASLLDTGMLEIFFAGMASFVHAAAMSSAQGVSARDFLPFARVMCEILPASLEGLAGDIDQGRYPGTEDRLSMELASLEHIVETSDELGLDGRLPRVLRDVAAEAVAAGHGDDGFSRTVEVVRRPRATGIRTATA